MLALFEFIPTDSIISWGEERIGLTNGGANAAKETDSD